MSSILDFNFNNEYSAKAFRKYVENDPTINNKKPHIGEKFFGTDSTDEADISFLIDNIEVNRLGSLGTPDMPTPFRGFKGTKMAKMGFPYFVEGWHGTQDEAMKIARLLKQTTGKPSDSAILKAVLDIYKRTNRIVEGMKDVREYMIMKMLVGCNFTLENADEYGTKITDVYNYDPDGSWAATNRKALSGPDAWSDVVNSDPIRDMMDADKALQAKGARLVAMIMSQTTLGYLLANQKIKNYTPFVSSVNPNYIMSRTDIEHVIEVRLGHKIDIIVDDEVFVGWDDTQQNFYPDKNVTFVGSYDLGTMWAGLTYEEAFNLVNGGNNYKDQVRLSNGIVVSEYMKADSDEKIFRVSQSCIPSFEGRNLVYNIYWA